MEGMISKEFCEILYRRHIVVSGVVIFLVQNGLKASLYQADGDDSRTVNGRCFYLTMTRFQISGKYACA